MKRVKVSKYELITQYNNSVKELELYLEFVKRIFSESCTSEDDSEIMKEQSNVFKEVDDFLKEQGILGEANCSLEFCLNISEETLEIINFITKTRNIRSKNLESIEDLRRKLKNVFDMANDIIKIYNDITIKEFMHLFLVYPDYRDEANTRNPQQEFVNHDNPHFTNPEILLEECQKLVTLLQNEIFFDDLKNDSIDTEDQSNKEMIHIQNPNSIKKETKEFEDYLLTTDNQKLRLIGILKDIFNVKSPKSVAMMFGVLTHKELISFEGQSRRDIYKSWYIRNDEPYKGDQGIIKYFKWDNKNKNHVTPECDADYPGLLARFEKELKNKRIKNK